MPQRKRASTINGGDATEADDVVADGADDFDDAESLADEADAEAAAAAAEAVAARARAKALRLRRQAAAGKAKRSDVAAETADTASAAETDTEPETVAEQPTIETAPDQAVTKTAETAETDVDEPVAEPLPATQERSARGGGRARLKLAAAGLAVLCILGLLGASGFMIVRHRHVEAEQQRSAEFAAAARQGVVTLMSLNFNNAKDDVKRILDNTTGDFKKDFAGQADEFTKVAQSSQVVTEATVNATAVQSLAQDTATVLVAVTTQVSNAASKQQEPRSWRLRVDMARDGGQIKMAKVEFVP